jgi:hypothetical protein
MVWTRRDRSCVTPSRKEVDLRGIDRLAPGGGWRVFPTDEWQVTGAVPKNYLAFGDPTDPETVAYFAKKGRLGRKVADTHLHAARECVTEEVISVIGRMLRLNIAKSRLVLLDHGKGGPPDVRFMSRNFLRRGEETLTHGVEMVIVYLGGGEERDLREAFKLENKAEERKFYNIETIVSVLKGWSRTEEERRQLLGGFAQMVTFDALVGAQDRHAMNWGIIENIKRLDAPRRFAPIFDTARGLFWNYLEEDLQSWEDQGVRESRLREYALKSRPIFGCTETHAGKDVNHFMLIDHLLRRPEAELVRPAVETIRGFNVDATKRALVRNFIRIFTPLRIGMIVDLLQMRHAELVHILKAQGIK